MPQSLLESAMERENFTVKEQAAVFAARLAQHKYDDPLVSHFARQEQRQLEPWRVNMQRRKGVS